MGRWSRFREGLFVAAIVAPWVVGCSDEFSNCEETRSCGHDNPGGSSGGDAGGTGGMSSSGSGGTVAGNDGSADVMLTCSEGFFDCNHDATDGCEAEIAVDPDHCGGCDQPCASDGVSGRACEAGACVPTCDMDHKDCNGDGRDGCEIDVTSNADHCGDCGNVCSADYASLRICAAGSCAPVCASTHGDCNTPLLPLLDDGCETPLTTETDCGACGHDCLGGGCSSQQCQPLVLGSGRRTPVAVTVDDEWVHWAEGGISDGRIVRVSTMGSLSGPTDLFLNQADPADIAHDGTWVYWVNAYPGSVNRVASGGSIAVPLASETTDPTFFDVTTLIAVDDANVYWADNTTRIVYQMPKAGGTITPICDPLTDQPRALAVDESDVYIAYLGLQRVPIGGGTAEPIVTTLPPVNLAIDSTHIYIDGSYEGGGAIGRLPKALDGSEEPVAYLAGLGALRGLKVSNDRVYFITTSGVYAADAAGGMPELLSADVNNPRDIEVYGGAVYWVNLGDALGSTGSVLKLAL